MPFDAVPSSAAVVVLGLASAIGWGISDFGGGWATKRAPLLGVLAVTQVLGVFMAVPLALVRGEAAPSSTDVALVVASGLLGAAGLGCLYHGLSVGRMGVVAPVTGVLVATIPVSAGMALEGVPSPVVLVGIGLAIASVVVVSRVPGEAGERTSGFWWGVGAGVTLGALTVALARVSDGLVFGPLALMRAVEAVAVVAAIVIAARLRPEAGGWRITRSLWPTMVAVGALDMGATGAYIAATQAGPLAIAAVLSALYPVVTVILAATLLRERVTRIHGLGIVAAAIAIVLIAGGAAA
jgi:drug/metabolite transporter (DMT)-like permease